MHTLCNVCNTSWVVYVWEGLNCMFLGSGINYSTLTVEVMSLDYIDLKLILHRELCVGITSCTHNRTTRHDTIMELSWNAAPFWTPALSWRQLTSLYHFL